MNALDIMKRPAAYVSGYENTPTEEQNRAKQLCWEYNRTAPNEQEKRRSILQTLLGTCSPMTGIQPDFHCDYGFNIHTHGLAVINYNCVILDTSPVNIGAGKAKRAKKSMFTGIGVGLVVGCIVFLLVMFGGDILAGFFTTDVAVIQKGYAYLKGFALETIVTAILFSMVGYFNGNNKTVWVMTQGLIQTLLVRLPFAYVMSIQPNASLTKIGLAAPVSTMVGIVLNVGFYIYLDRAEKKSNAL